MVKSAMLSTVARPMGRRGAISLLVGAGALSGCATLIEGQNQVFTLRSAPDGATVRITDEAGQDVYAGLTPGTVTLARGGGYFHGKDYTVTIQKDGYQPYSTKLESRASAWYILGNMVLVGPIGWLIVDPLTGAIWTFPSAPVEAVLAPVTAAAGEAPMLGVTTLDQVPADRRQDLIRIAG